MASFCQAVCTARQTQAYRESTPSLGNTTAMRGQLQSPTCVYQKVLQCSGGSPLVANSALRPARQDSNRTTVTIWNEVTM